MLDDGTLDRLSKLQGAGIHRSEGAMLAKLAADVPLGQYIVELGSYKGKSAAFMATGAASGNGAPVFCVDMWRSKQETHRRFLKHGIFATFERELTDMGVREYVTAMRGRSVKVAEQWDESRPIGLLFIDAGHSYAAVKADFEAWSPFVPFGGYVVFHDYGNPRWLKHVNRFVDELVAAGGWDGFEVVGHAAKVQRHA